MKSHNPTEAFWAQFLSNLRRLVRSESSSVVTFVPVRNVRAPLLCAEI